MKDLRRNQRGFASLIIAIIIVLVLALMTVGFAQLVRREQNSALNKQLSTQAYYAAESGVNDAYRDLLNTVSTGGSLAPKTTCPDIPAYPSLKNEVSGPPNLSSANSVGYTCVLVNGDVTSLNYQKVSSSSPTTATVSVGSGITPSSLTIYWDNQSASDCFQTGGFSQSSAFPSGPSWGSNCTDVLKFSVTPISRVNDLHRGNLDSNTFYTLLYPSTAAGGSTSYTGGLANQAIVSGQCSATQGTPIPGLRNPNSYCSVTINNLAGFGAGSSFVITMQGVYDADATGSNVVITGLDTASTPIHFVNTQAVIDSTGRAQDVLKRIQVRVALGTGSTGLPANAVAGVDGVCKRMLSMSGNTQYLNFSNNAATGSGSADNIACKPQ